MSDTYGAFQPGVIGDQLAPLCALVNGCEPALGSAMISHEVSVDDILTGGFANCFGGHSLILAWDRGGCFLCRRSPGLNACFYAFNLREKKKETYDGV